MGQGWRRVTELMRQASMSRLPAYIPGVDSNFRPTSNARNTEMFREASEFATHLRTLEKDLLALHYQVDESLANMRGILLSPLPRVYEEGQHGPVPSEEDARIIGQNVHVDRITEAGREMRRRLDSEVIQPVKQWMVAYRTIQDRMKQLEALRLELDSRRRTVADLQGRFERQRSVLGTSGSSRFQADLAIEQLASRAAHKEEKQQRTSSQYREMEQTVYNSLFTLVKDTSVLRDYAAAALLIAEECFQAAHASFHQEGGSVGALEYGSTTNAPTLPQYGGGSGLPEPAAVPVYTVAADGVLEYSRRAPEVVKVPSNNIFRTLSEKVGLGGGRSNRQDVAPHHPPAEAAVLGNDRGGGTSGGGGHDSDGGYDQGYHGGLSEYDGGGAVMLPPSASSRGGGYAAAPAAHAYGNDGGGGHFRTGSAFGGAGGPPATNNRYASALPPSGGWNGVY